MVLFRLGDWGATLETVRAYVDAQGAEEHARKEGMALKQALFSRPHPGSRQGWCYRLSKSAHICSTFAPSAVYKFSLEGLLLILKLWFCVGY